MYTITFQIPVFPLNEHRFAVPVGLARDVITQLRYEPQLRLIFPRAPRREWLVDSQEIDLREHAGLSIGLLPWNGSGRSWPLRHRAVRRALIDEARNASVWHTGCSLSIWDLASLSEAVGRKYAPGLRVLCLDSDPVAMLQRSGSRWDRMRAVVTDRQIRLRARRADATIFVGVGAAQRFSESCRQWLMTGAVWLQTGDLADVDATTAKYAGVDTQTLRLAVASRLTGWKGVDDVIEALTKIADRCPRWELDVIGTGPERKRLVSQARNLPNVRFVDPVPYGEPFFQKLRTYHLVIVPTRGMEETRVVYDAAASGCALLHSKTATLEAALDGLTPRWNFRPGCVEELAETLLDAFARRSAWLDAALAGLAFSRGRTIDEMHRLRATFLSHLRSNSGCWANRPR